MSNSVWPHRQQPTRLPRPWDSPGKNTGVGCHFLLQCMKVKSESEVVQSCLTLSDPMDCNLPGSSVHGIFQARVLEWGAITFSNSSSNEKKWLFSLKYLPILYKHFSSLTKVLFPFINFTDAIWNISFCSRCFFSGMSMYGYVCDLSFLKCFLAY